ncbi:hypothetical protein ACTMTJ_08485 [Phytohabitans sp. LJ34]|uniref:hypothetical protein n=1 Tax=Phytohabitans sp. LJ34 TaxID=3452217 RepID=UPI003F88EE00
MVTLWLVQLLLRMAAKRWPRHLRDEMLAEWRGELHELASRRQQRRMLWFAASLAATRPRLGGRAPLFDPDASIGRVLRHAALLVAAPVACVWLGLFGTIGLVLSVPLVMLAWVAGLTSPLLRPWSVVGAVVLPAVVVVVATPSTMPSFDEAWRMPTATLVWGAILAAAMLVAVRLSPRLAVLVGGAGAVAGCWLASTLAVAPHAARLGLDPSYTAMWYPADLLWPGPIDVPLGVLPTTPDNCVGVDGVCTSVRPAVSMLTDFTEGYSTSLTMIAIYALAYLVAAMSTLDLDENPLPSTVSRPVHSGG